MKQEKKTVTKGKTVTFFEDKITIFLKNVSGSRVHVTATAPFCRTQEIEKLVQKEKIEFSCSEFDCDVALTEAVSRYSSGGFFGSSSYYYGARFTAYYNDRNKRYNS